MRENNIYRVDQKLENARGRLEANPQLPRETKDVLRRFVEEQAAVGLSEYRQLWYLTHLVPFAEQLRGDFLEPTEDQVRKLVAAVNRSRLSEWSKTNKRTALKRFYKWLLGRDEEYPPCVRWVKTKGGNHKRTLPDDLLSRDEIRALIEAAVNPRDRALIALLADGGLRIGEALNLRVKDVHPDRHGAYLMVPTGKTGARRVRLIESVPHLAVWRRVHPLRDREEAPLFCYLSAQEPGEGKKRRIRGHAKGEALQYAAARKALRDAAVRAGVKPGKVNPHNFRHTRATILAKTVPEAPLEAQMGWVHGSQMSRVYVSLSGRDVDEAILRSHGIEMEDEGKTRVNPLRECPRCGEFNEAEGPFCQSCGMALREGAVLQAEEDTQDALDALLKLAENPARLRRLMKILEGQD